MSDRPEVHRETAARSLLREVGTRLGDALSNVPRKTKRTFALTLLIGFLTLLGLEVLVATLAESHIGESAPQLDRDVMRWATDLPVTRNHVRWLDAWGNALVTWPLAIFAAGMAAWKRLPFRALAFFPGYAATEVFTLLGWWVWSRPRPQMGPGPQIEWHSFPSGHVIHAVFLFALLCWAWASSAPRRGEKIVAWSVFVFVAVAMGLIRLIRTMHWPTDVAFGLLLGGAWAAVVIGAVIRAERSVSREG